MWPGKGRDKYSVVENKMETSGGGWELKNRLGVHVGEPIKGGRHWREKQRERERRAKGINGGRGEERDGGRGRE